MKHSPVDRTFDPLSKGMHNSFVTKCHLEHYSTEATIYHARADLFVFLKVPSQLDNDHGKWHKGYFKTSLISRLRLVATISKQSPI